MSFSPPKFLSSAETATVRVSSRIFTDCKRITQSLGNFKKPRSVKKEKSSYNSCVKKS